MPNKEIEKTESAHNGWKLLEALIFAIIAVGSLTYWLLQDADYKILYLGGNKQISLRVADDETEREKGLSGTKFIANNEGMLFIFDYPAKWGIWMIDMNYSIDIIWINEDKQIIDIAEGVSPKSYPKVFYPNGKAKYIIELNAGYAKKNNFKIGSKINL